MQQCYKNASKKGKNASVKGLNKQFLVLLFEQKKFQAKICNWIVGGFRVSWRLVKYQKILFNLQPSLVEEIETFNGKNVKLYKVCHRPNFMKHPIFVKIFVFVLIWGGIFILVFPFDILQWKVENYNNDWQSSMALPVKKRTRTIQNVKAFTFSFHRHFLILHWNEYL